MKRHLGYYVHHHGRGHLSRAEALIRHLRVPVTVLTSSRVRPADVHPAEILHLTKDTDPPETTLELPPPRHLHYAPVGVPGLRDRSGTITRFLTEAEPALVVVDVSVEVTQLVRLTGTPVVVVRQSGRRWDPPHRSAYDAAWRLLAPFPAALEEPDVPDEVRDKTFYAGGFTRHVCPLPTRADARNHLGWGPDEPVVVVLTSTGGAGPAPESIRAAAAASCHRWVVVGRDEPNSRDVRGIGWVDDPQSYLVAADVVVGSAGHNSVMEIAAAGTPFVCVPEERPFGEQTRKAARLRDLDAAEVVSSWPAASDWPELLDRATRRGRGRLAGILADDGAARAARWLEELVDIAAT